MIIQIVRFLLPAQCLILFDQSPYITRVYMPITRNLEYLFTQWLPNCLTNFTNSPTNGLLFTKSYSLLGPIKKLDIILPAFSVFLLFVMHPLFTKSITPPANISECIPRSLCPVSAANTASGMLPIPATQTQTSLAELF